MHFYTLPIKDRREIADGTIAIWLDTIGVDYNFKPGQWAEFHVPKTADLAAEGNEREFSFASSPRHKDFFMIAFRRGKSVYKKSLENLPIGSNLSVSEAYGSLVLGDKTERPAVLLAGGIGVTLFRSMVEWAVENKLQRRIFLFHSNSTMGETAFYKDFIGWEKEHHLFSYIPTVTDSFAPGWSHERGRINMEMIRARVPDILSVDYYIAGPPQMTLALWQMLSSAGVADGQIRTEEFTGY